MSIWWGDHLFEEGQTRHWQIGPRNFWVTREDLEWRVTQDQGGSWLEGGLIVGEAVDSPPDGSNLTTRRFSAGSQDDRLTIEPAHADRPVVVKTTTPFLVPPDSQSTFFVSLPLWIQVSASAGVLEDFPVLRPSDTWFGPDTVTGEACYASYTSARLRLENVPRRPDRAVCEIRVRNDDGALLPIERLKIPVRQLSLYSSASELLWSESLTMANDSERGRATVRLDNTPTRAESPELVSKPRERLRRGFLLDAFGGLFGTLQGHTNE